MNIREWVVGGLALGVGALIGNSLSGSYLDGRLSACKDMVSVINQGIPLQLECSIEQGDVFIGSALQPGVKFSLDGKKSIGK